MNCPKCGFYMIPDFEWCIWDCQGCGYSETDMSLYCEDTERALCEREYGIYAPRKESSREIH